MLVLFDRTLNLIGQTLEAYIYIHNHQRDGHKNISGYLASAVVVETWKNFMALWRWVFNENHYNHLL